jgi:hypothetical protein
MIQQRCLQAPDHNVGDVRTIRMMLHSPSVERVFVPQRIMTPAIQSSLANSLHRGNNQTTLVEHPGSVVHTRRTENPREIDLRATLNHAVLEKGNSSTLSLRVA